MNINISELKVQYNNVIVGYLKLLKDSRVAFQYDLEWLENGFSISPFSLPLTNDIYISDSPYFKGLYGVFFDSLPDGWGEYLIRKLFLKKGVNFDKVSILSRLSILNYTSLGALEYIPVQLQENHNYKNIDLDLINDSIIKELNDSNEAEMLDELFNLGGASGGARPKIHLKVDDDYWIIKFQSRFDGDNHGLMEYKTNMLAKQAMINTNDFKLFSSNNNSGFFGAKRFDRLSNRKVHTISVAALLETTHKISNLDYYHIFQIIEKISVDKNDIEEMFRRVVFNVLVKNKDDHSKNHSFIYDENKKGYVLSKAYDITITENKLEHEVTVNGKGNPTIDDLYILANKIHFSKSKAKEIIEEFKELISNSDLISSN